MIKEAKNINKSLFILGRVIADLANNTQVDSTFVKPRFRESKLTKILSDSLNGSAEVVMITCASPAQCHYEITKESLLFAQNMMNLQIQSKTVKSTGLCSPSFSHATAVSDRNSQVFQQNLLNRLRTEIAGIKAENLTLKQALNDKGLVLPPLPIRSQSTTASDISNVSRLCGNGHKSLKMKLIEHLEEINTPNVNLKRPVANLSTVPQSRLVRPPACRQATKPRHVTPRLPALRAPTAVKKSATSRSEDISSSDPMTLLRAYPPHELEFDFSLMNTPSPAAPLREAIQATRFRQSGAYSSMKESGPSSSTHQGSLPLWLQLRKTSCSPVAVCTQLDHSQSPDYTSRCLREDSLDSSTLSSDLDSDHVNVLQRARTVAASAMKACSLALSSLPQYH
jgi:hypothetical protein